MARLTGSNRNDIFSLSASQLSSLQLRAGRGYDTLKVQGSGELQLSSLQTSRWRELEALDFSAFTGNVSLAVSPNLLATSNTRTLDITIGSGAELSLSSSVAGVVLHGAGVVKLSDASSNIVHIGSSDVVVEGGTAADNITASAFGNRLDGGGGDDFLFGGVGADVFVHGAGEGHDTFNAFNVTQDKIDLSGTGVQSWHDLKQMMQQTEGGVVITFPDGSSLMLAGVSLASLSVDNVVADGAPLPLYDNSITIQPGTSASEINSIIAAAPDGAVITFAAGVHEFSESIVVTRGNITLQGEGAGATTLMFSEGSGIADGLIQIGRVTKTYVTTVSTSAQAMDSTLTLASTEGLSVGDTIYIYQPNTAEYLAANGWTNVSMTEAESRPFREYIVTITTIDGNIIYLDKPLPYDFSTGETRVFEMDVLNGVVLQDFSVDTSNSPANTSLFQNQAAGFEGVSAIHAAGTDGLVMRGLTLQTVPSIGITLNSTINATLDTITIDGSLNLGGGGNGYGILLSEAFHNTLTNLTITEVRHAIVFSAWNAEAFNAIHVLETDRDINFHGSPDFGNTVSVDRSILNYDTAIDPSVWSIVSRGGTNHAATDIFNDNQVRFAFAIGSSNVDTIFGADGGSYLNGKGSNDFLVGGAGNDTIVGGLRRDVLTGGDGADSFVFKMGDDLDTITDMTFGANGDTIVIMGNPAVDGFEDLVFTQDGADVRVRYGSNSTIILKDTLLSEVSAENFVFDPTSSNYLDEWIGN